MPSTGPETDAGAGAPLQVAVGVLRDARGRVLISQRPPGVHQGGLWEFPGGKREPGESPCQALVRELREELGIEVRQARAFMRIPWNYPEQRLLLDVWKVTAWHGIPRGREGQPVRWVPVDELHPEAFPPANAPILDRLQLPPLCLITPAPDGHDLDGFRGRLARALVPGVGLVVWRAPNLSAVTYGRWAPDLAAVCRRRGAWLQWHWGRQAPPSGHAGGVHLSAGQLRRWDGVLPRVPGPVGASCHDAAELERAARLGLDYAFLSPVRPTASHPGAQPLGWRCFAELAGSAGLPVYALGGLGPADLARVRRQGAWGVAAIRGLWPGDGP